MRMTPETVIGPVTLAVSGMGEAIRVLKIRSFIHTHQQLMV